MKHSILCTALFGLTLLAAPRVRAVTVTWISPDSGYWGDGSNWAGGSMPVNGDDVVLGTHSAATNDVYAIYSSSYTGAGLNSLTIDAVGITGTFTLYQPFVIGGAMVANNEYIGRTTTRNVYEQGGGTNTVANGLFLAGYVSSGSSSGAYNLYGGLLDAGTEYVGYYSTNTLNQFHQTGGGNTANYEIIGYGDFLGHGGVGAYTQDSGYHHVNNALYLGYGYDSTGTYTLNGGTLYADSEGIGAGGTGHFYQTGGSHTIAHALTLGSNFSGNETYDLSGTGTLSTTDEIIGESGYGSQATFTQSGRVNTASGKLYVGYSDSGGGAVYTLGKYVLSGGALMASEEHIGEYDVGTSILAGGTFNQAGGTFIQTGGTNQISYALSLGYRSTGSGVYQFSGRALSANLDFIGYDGTGTFTQSGGTNTVNINMVLGYNTGSSGAYSISGTGIVNALFETVGDSGTGSFTQTGGTNTASNILWVLAALEGF